MSEPAILSTPYIRERVQFSDGGIVKQRYPKAHNYPAQTSRYERISTFRQEQISTSSIDRSQILAPVLPLHPVAPCWQPAPISIRQQKTKLNPTCSECYVTLTIKSRDCPVPLLVRFVLTPRQRFVSRCEAFQGSLGTCRRGGWRDEIDRVFS